MDKIIDLTLVLVCMIVSLWAILNLEKQLEQLKFELAQEKLNVLALSGIYEDKNDICTE